MILSHHIIFLTSLSFFLMSSILLFLFYTCLDLGRLRFHINTWELGQVLHQASFSHTLQWHSSHSPELSLYFKLFFFVWLRLASGFMLPSLLFILTCLNLLASLILLHSNWYWTAIAHPFQKQESCSCAFILLQTSKQPTILFTLSFDSSSTYNRCCNLE